MSYSNAKSTNSVLEARWNLSKVNVGNAEQGAFIQLSKNKLTGFDGCNRIFGDFQTDYKSSLSFINVAKTKKVCSKGNSQSINVQLTMLLRSITHFKINQTQLIMLDANNKQLVFQL